jgi:hypothetical protein
MEYMTIQAYTRYNLRINGMINITDKFSIIPNAKLSLADSELANHGPSEWKNPVIATALKPSIMAPYAKDASTGINLDYLDDVGDVFMVSNPAAITQNAHWPKPELSFSCFGYSKLPF